MEGPQFGKQPQEAQLPPTAATKLAISQARQHFIALDTLATHLNVPAVRLLDVLEVELLESLNEGS